PAPSPGIAGRTAPGADGPPSDPSGDAGIRRSKPPVAVQIDFDGLGQRIISVPGIPEKQYFGLEAGADGTVFYIDASNAAANQGPPSGDLIRYKLTDRKSTPFASGVAAFAVSADGKKLVYRSAGPPPTAIRPPGAGPTGPSLFLVDADKLPP